MKQDHAAFILKLIIWALFVVGSAFNVFAQIVQFNQIGLDAWTLAYLPVDFAYFAGALYVGVNFKSVISHHRLTLIKSMIALFVVDTLYIVAGVIAQIKSPESFMPAVAPTSPGAIIAGAVTGLAVSALVLFATIQLINIASGISRSKPPVWLTVFAWVLVGLIIAGVIVYASGL